MQPVKLRNLKDTPFPLYDDLAALNDGKYATGEDAFTVSQLFAVPTATPETVLDTEPLEDVMPVSRYHSSLQCFADRASFRKQFRMHWTCKQVQCRH